ncbi:MAG TPA: GNAT family N-acetyltransferase [Phycisphaerales bacterium]|nr:GNAT family N-acetyltransferase [Phycisphaerales bacterium]
MWYGPLGEAEHARGYARVLAHSFARTEAETGEWVARLARAEPRVGVTEGGHVAAGLVLYPMGQFFGGRSVPMWGVAAVGVAPEARGAGVARELMRRAVLELFERGVALSALYPATQALYRRVGYEQAGSRFELRVPLARLDRGAGEVGARALTDEDRAAIAAVYAQCARAREGALDRSELMWERVLSPPPRREPAHGFVFPGPGGPGGIEGYALLTQSRLENGHHEVHVSDLAFVTAGAGARLVRFLSGYGTLGTDLVWHCGPGEPLLMLLGEQRYSVKLHHYWMLRVTHVRAALEARGYPAGLSGRLTLRVRDEEAPGNAGTVNLEVEQCVGRCGARGGVVLEVGARGLAALYAGFATPESLARAGLLAGEAGALGLARAMFAGAAPGMGDFF